MNLSLDDCKAEFNKVKREIERLLKRFGDDADNLVINREDLDEVFMRDQYQELSYKLNDVLDRLNYLSKPVVEQGHVQRNEQGRYELPSGTYLMSGSTCEILYYSRDTEEDSWIYTTIEHNGDDYYATSLGKSHPLQGMMVRIRG